jgi:hypothetical protein
MTTGFDKAAFLGDIDMFKRCLAEGVDHSTLDHFRRTPVFGLRFCYNASVDAFVDVLRAFIDAGADIDHIDSFGNTLLLLMELDNLGAALVQVGTKISYEWQDYSKRALANAAVHGCTGTIDAIVRSRVGRPDQIHQRDFDSSLDQAAKVLAYNPAMSDMSGIVKLVVDYGANPNTWSTLHYSSKRNHVIVSTLIALGANTDTLAWDFEKGLKNTPLHRVADMATTNVYEALVTPTTDVDIKDSSGATPLMAMMKIRPLLHSDEAVMAKFNWLLERGASCLPVDHKGRRVSDMARSKNSPFKEIIAVRIKEQNWLKRRGVVLLRARNRIWIRRSRRNMTLVEKVARLHVDGVFRHIVTFL